MKIRKIQVYSRLLTRDDGWSFSRRKVTRACSSVRRLQQEGSSQWPWEISLPRERDTSSLLLFYFSVRNVSLSRATSRRSNISALSTHLAGNSRGDTLVKTTITDIYRILQTRSRANSRRVALLSKRPYAVFDFPSSINPRTSKQLLKFLPILRTRISKFMS